MDVFWPVPVILLAWGPARRLCQPNRHAPSVPAHIQAGQPHCWGIYCMLLRAGSPGLSGGGRAGTPGPTFLSVLLTQEEGQRPVSFPGS